MDWINAWLFPVGSVVLGGVGLWLVWRGATGGGVVRRTRSCRRCGYDMTATEGATCPECGRVHRHEGEHYAGRRRWWVAAMGLVVLVGAAGMAKTPDIRRDGWLGLLPLELQVRLFHWETNEAAFASLDRRLGRSEFGSVFGNGRGWAPAPAPIDPDRQERLEAVMHRVAMRNLRRPTPTSLEIDRSIGLIMRHTRDRLTEDELLVLVDVLGVTDRSVQMLLANRALGEDSSLAEARRGAFDAANASGRMALGWSMVRFRGGDGDVSRIGEWLAAPEPDGDPGSEHALSRVRDGAGYEIPVGAYEAYAGLIRREGACGNFRTLRDAASRSPAVCGAAVDWALSLPEGDDRERWLGVLYDVRPRFDAALIDADWSKGREAAESKQKLYRANEVMRLMRGLDVGFSAWLIGLARDPDSPHRETAVYELRGMRFDRERAVEYAFGEGWRDETLSLNARMWPLVHMEAWYGSAIPAETDLASYWGDVLERAAVGRRDAFEEGFGRFANRTYGQSSFALIAVGRRLLDMGGVEPWLPRLAVEIAESNGATPDIPGFLKVLREHVPGAVQAPAAVATIRDELESLAAGLEQKFGLGASDPQPGQP